MVQGMQKFQTVGKLWRKTASHQMREMSNPTKGKVCHDQKHPENRRHKKQQAQHPSRNIFSERKLTTPFVFQGHIYCLEMNISVHMIFIVGDL